MRSRDILDPTFEQYVVSRDLKKSPIREGGVHGVATNDADYVTCIQERLPNWKRKFVWMCPAYVAWQNVVARSYSSKFKQSRPTYKDVAVCGEWLFFSNFRDWWVENNVRGWQLDKDILHKGNAVYCPDSCIYIPGYINTLLTDHATARGDYPMGVFQHQKKFQSHVRRDGCRKYLGYFNTPEQAHKAWQIGKIKAIKEGIDKYIEEANSLGVFDVRIVDALTDRIATLEDDVANGRETFVLH